jgi:hypothetical protein
VIAGDHLYSYVLNHVHIPLTHAALISAIEDVKETLNKFGVIVRWLIKYWALYALVWVEKKDAFVPPVDFFLKFFPKFCLGPPCCFPKKIFFEIFSKLFSKIFSQNFQVFRDERPISQIILSRNVRKPPKNLEKKF